MGVSGRKVELRVWVVLDVLISCERCFLGLLIKNLEVAPELESGSIGTPLAMVRFTFTLLILDGKGGPLLLVSKDTEDERVKCSSGQLLSPSVEERGVGCVYFLMVWEIGISSM